MSQRLGVARSTAFRWHHRFLACPKSIQARQLRGIAGADESYFRIFWKGQRGLLCQASRREGKSLAGARSWEYTPDLMVRDRAGATVNVILDSSKAPSVRATLAPLLPSDMVLCIDASVTLASDARALGVQHQTINVSRGICVRGPWRAQSVNAFVSRLRGWMRSSKDVATKYLDSYFGWFRMLDRYAPTGTQRAAVLGLAIGG